MDRVLVVASGAPSHVSKQVDAITRLPNVEAEVTAYLLHVLEESAAADHEPMRVQGVSAAAESLEEHDVRFEVVGRIGNPVSEVLQLAAEKAVDAIYVGGAKRTPAGKAVFGSDVQRIILKADRPVTVTLE